MDPVQHGGPSRLPLTLPAAPAAPTAPATSSRRPWTTEEDTALCAAVKKYGLKSSWSKISSSVGGSRTNKVCHIIVWIGFGFI
jgi:hypothetical protein